MEHNHYTQYLDNVQYLFSTYWFISIKLVKWSVNYRYIYAEYHSISNKPNDTDNFKIWKIEKSLWVVKRGWVPIYIFPNTWCPIPYTYIYTHTHDKTYLLC